MAELFRVRPEEFVARRDQLVRELRQAGDKAGAAEVKALRRPTAAAWAVNQVAARHPEGVAQLVALGERLRAAHEALLEGGGTSSIREITAEQRRLVAELTDIAVRLLGPAGEGQRDAISQTLDAAVADPDQGELVRSARLTKELAAPSGFGGLDVLFGQVTPGPPLRSTTADVAADAEQERAERRRKELELRERQARLERLRLEAERREAEAASAAQKVAALRQELEELTARLDIAQRRATAAADAASAARAEVEQAEARD